MFVEDFQRIGKTIFEAIDLADQAFGGEKKEQIVEAMDPDAGVAQLNALMGGAR